MLPASSWGSIPSILGVLRVQNVAETGVLPPLQRMFFWETGFRVTRKYRVMRYQLSAGDNGGPSSQHVAEPAAPAVKQLA